MTRQVFCAAFANSLRARILGAMLLALMSAPACAEQKIALVIGNSAYRKVVQLPNPVNDAADMAASLTRLGFTVKHLTDLDYNAFRLALIDFGNAAKTADKAVLFFAGHGVEIDGRNWLIPVDAQIKSEVDVYAEAINLETLIDISLLPKVIGLVILDACRNDPFAAAKLAARRSAADGKPGAKSSSRNAREVTASRSDPAGAAPAATDNVASAASRGLAPVDVNDNVLVAFSAAAGTTANDGTGRNSPYSGSLVRHVETPGLEINYLFRMVHDDVVAETRTQQPAIYGTLSTDEVYLKGDAAVAAAAAEAEAERVAWAFVRSTNEIATLRRFQEQFPASPHAAEAGDRIVQLQAAENFAWTLVGQQRSAAAYRAFLDLYPRGEFVEQARTTLASLEKSPGARQTSKDAAKPVDLPKPPASAYQLDTASPDATTKNSESIEKVWAMLRDSPDQKVAGRFAEKYPSMRHHRLPPGSDMALRRVDPTELMLRTAQDEDVNGCFGGDTAACGRAAAKYPDYVQLQFQRCRILENRIPESRERNRSRCMADAVRDARRRGYLVSAYTRSAQEIERNRAYRKTVERVNQNVGNIVGNVVSNVVSNTVATSVSNAVSAASQAAATAAANAASAAAASAASHAASRAAAHAASTAASSAASRAASTAASGAASRAASSAASRAAGFAASRAASGAADRAAAQAAKKASEAAAAAASNAASNIRVPSDRRLKQDIVLLGRTTGGLHLYRYRYIGDSTLYVGVMAQDVATVVPAAVSQADNGYLQVDYRQLGIAFLTWRGWMQRSLSHAAK